ncbi:SET domain-containing protein [Acaromyces ingoldii]|uniref:SET domain-containing protein n=1 Tax=Acaromyces ingoldii TaxID=215250 RepID=A0A316YZC9_9BASI|nr:SET domain-containing protein [Acaromyces ingoldii]PWN93175.1 SET domain-containing protein [Acaromyces ingoldii]
MSYNDSIVARPSGARQTCSETTESFVRFFSDSGGSLDKRCGLAEFAEMGVGMVAVAPIPEDAVLFSIPRHLLLSVRTSLLPELCRATDSAAAQSSGLTWDKDVGVGWLPLITTMMWERWRTSPEGRSAWEQRQQQQQQHSNGSQSRSQEWGPYFDVLPKTFDTPMFWSSDELEELRGTTVVDKIGKDEASKDYFDILLPYIRSRADIFFGSAKSQEAQEQMVKTFYSIEDFHLMGSRILSRSFHVKKPEAGQEGPVGDIMDDEGEADGNEDDEMDEDGQDKDDNDGEEAEEEEEEGAEAIEAVTIVPMADMLNARFGCDNARLFYKEDVLEMRATRNIEQNEQIWNTYGEPPSSDLLRRYGYVDLANVNDVVEVAVSHLVGACLDLEQISEERTRTKREAELMARAEWWASEGLDEVFALSYAFPPSSQPPHRPEPVDPSAKELKAAASAFSEEILVAARILCLSEENFERAKKKAKMPNARIEAEEQHGSNKTMGVAELLIRALEKRRQEYPTSIEEDEELLYGQQRSEVKDLRARNAIVVRLSEKRIIEDNIRVLRGAIELGRAAAADAKKRTTTSESNGRAGKKAKR